MAPIASTPLPYLFVAVNPSPAIRGVCGVNVDIFQSGLRGPSRGDVLNEMSAQVIFSLTQMKGICKISDRNV